MVLLCQSFTSAPAELELASVSPVDQSTIEEESYIDVSADNVADLSEEVTVVLGPNTNLFTAQPSVSNPPAAVELASVSPIDQFMADFATEDDAGTSLFPAASSLSNSSSALELTLGSPVDQFIADFATEERRR